jgi:ComF family protein
MPAFLRKAAGALFGGRCHLCRGVASGVLCAGCLRDLPRIPAAQCCPRCALASAAGAPCGRCLSRPPAYDATVAALEYRFPADVLIGELKFRSELALAGLLALELSRAAQAACSSVDRIVPVPLARARLAGRGFNQALEIAREVARDLGVAMDDGLCERTRATDPQPPLAPRARAANVRGAFRATRSAAGLRIAVLDDVMTTGATLEEVARALKAAGAATVVNWVVARTPEPQETVP